MLSLLRLSFLPTSTDLGLLLLRLGAGASMLWLHGKGKLENFQKMADDFQAIVVSGKVSLGLTVFAEVVCAGLLVLGLFGRSAALVLAITMGVAFFKVHGMKLVGQGSGELALMYLVAYVVLFLSGPGKFSLDGVMGGGSSVGGGKSH